MIFFLKILIAHFVGDFLLQPDSWVQDKRKKKLKSARLYFHLGIHTLLLALLLEFNTKYWIGFMVIIASHFLIDILKLWTQQYKFNSKAMFLLDQTAHILILAVVSHAYYPIIIDIDNILSYSNLLLTAALLIVTFVSAIGVKIFISKWNPEDMDYKEDSLSKAGRFIGMLERLFVFVFVVIGRWEAIGFLLASKSVFRFGDLKESKDRKLTEYMLIGTLLSFGIAILVGLIYLEIK